jgi:hypothetical protein
MIQRVLAILFLLFPIAAFAQGATEASVERLFAAMNVERSITGIYTMMDGMMKQSMAQALPANPTPQQRQVVEASRQGFIAVMREELSWERMKPDLVRAYSETFSEAEVLGIVAFYETPAGQALVNKTPQLTQKSMALAQERMKELIPRMKAAAEKAALDARAAEGR